MQRVLRNGRTGGNNGRQFPDESLGQVAIRLVVGGGGLLQEAPFGFRSRQVKGDSGEELKEVPLPVVQV